MQASKHQVNWEYSENTDETELNINVQALGWFQCS